MKIDGLKVQDTRKPLPLIITHKDCTMGNTKNPQSCAAARAICRQKGIEEARVHIARVYVKSNGKWIRYMTPRALRSEIIAFDRGGKFEPGEFKLLPIQPTVRFDAPKNGKVYERDGSRPQKRSKAHTVKGIRGRASIGAKYR